MHYTILTDYLIVGAILYVALLGFLFFMEVPWGDTIAAMLVALLVGYLIPPIIILSLGRVD